MSWKEQVRRPGSIPAPAAEDRELTQRLEKLVEGLRGELSGLVQKISDARQAVAYLQPELDFATGELPAASDALAQVCRATEIATHGILAIVEALLDRDASTIQAVQHIARFAEKSGDPEAAAAARQIADAHTDRGAALTDLITHLCFQDITSQTITRTTEVILQIEERLLGILTSLNGSGQKAKATLSEAPGLAVMRDLEKGQSRQDVIDNLLRESRSRLPEVK